MLKKITSCAAQVMLALFAVQLVSASTTINFQVDMTYELGVDFNPASQKVYAHGTFNGWGNGVLLTNNSLASNTNIYSGSVTNAHDTNGAVMEWKYVINTTSNNNDNYENTQNGHNRCLITPTNSGATVTVDLAYFSDNHETVATGLSENMTFQVDMAQQIALGKFVPGTSHVYAQGGFEGWTDSGGELFNDPTIMRTNSNGVVTTNVYTGIFSVFSAPGGTENYQFVMNSGNGDQYEAPLTGDYDTFGSPRFFDGQTSNSALPIVFFSDAPFNPIKTNLVTFQVDMSAQILNGSFNPSVSQVNVNGTFNNFTANVNVLTNNPSGANSNLYSGQITIVNGLGASEQYKFTTTAIGQNTNPNYESLANTTPQQNGNRFLNIVSNSAVVLPVVYFSDVAPVLSDYLTNSVTVTFTVNMTNAVGTDSTVWDPSVNVYINGDFIGWPAFNTSLPQLTETAPGVGSIYTFTTNFPAGKPVVVNYDYSMNGAADETSGGNHVRYIRSYGTYNFPIDVFGSPVVENSFGNLTVGAPAGGHVPITWLGRPGVHLQSTTNLISGTWTDVAGTDAMSATNLTVTGTQQYYRLVHPLH